MKAIGEHTMEAEVTKRINLSLSEEEARWLHLATQYPLKCTPEKEPHDDREIRCAFFHATTIDVA